MTTWRPLVLRAALGWLPLAVAITAVATLVYVLVQQELRTGANEPQVQMAEDAAAQLDAGAGPDSVLPHDRVEVARSLAPFLMVFDGSAHLVASSASLHGQPPQFPVGVLENVRRHGETRLTWQPEPGVRSASVTVPWRDGFVVAGRSLRLVEEREELALHLALAGWAVALAGVAAMTGLVAALDGARG